MTTTVITVTATTTVTATITVTITVPIMTNNSNNNSNNDNDNNSDSNNHDLNTKIEAAGTNNRVPSGKFWPRQHTSLPTDQHTKNHEKYTNNSKHKQKQPTKDKQSH